MVRMPHEGVGLSPEFLELARFISDYTLVFDRDRLWNLWHMAEQAAKGRGDVIEVGVWRGGTAYWLASAFASVGSRRQMHLCDTFAGVPPAGERDNFYKGGEHADADRDAVCALMKPFPEALVYKGLFPQKTGRWLEHLKFCFAHIDVDIYDSARDAFAFIWPRMTVGGIVVFDDYGEQSCMGVTEFVESERERKDAVFLHPVPCHAVFIRTHA
jgi:O-methyltransferase